MPTDSHLPPPLSQNDLRACFAARGVQIGDLAVLDSTASTNDVAVDLAGQGAPAWSLVTAEHQTGGRGRLGRHWESTRSSNLLFSVVLRPGSLHSALGWLPLLGGVAVAQGVKEVTGIEAQVKWPNDVVIVGEQGPRKLAGLLAERTPDAVIVGVGLNVHAGQAELPIPTATSIAIETGTTPDRAQLLAAVLDAWQRLWADFEKSSEHLRQTYREWSATLGTAVKAIVNDQTELVGTVVDVDSDGHLVIETEFGALQTITAADIQHLRRS